MLEPQGDMTMIAEEIEALSASRKGDRDAYGRIVARYQSMVSAAGLTAICAAAALVAG